MQIEKNSLIVEDYVITQGCGRMNYVLKRTMTDDGKVIDYKICNSYRGDAPRNKIAEQSEILRYISSLKENVD